MPTGQKTIQWTQENDQRLLLSILAVHNVKVEYPDVARVFGNGIAASVIQTRVNKLKAKAKALNPGAVPTAAVLAPMTAKRSRVTKNTTKSKSKVKVEPNEEPDENEESNANHSSGQGNDFDQHRVTPPPTPSQKEWSNSFTAINAMTPSPEGSGKAPDSPVATKRCAPRAGGKPGHRKLNDPFVATVGTADDEERNVHGDGNGTQTGDSYDKVNDSKVDEVSEPIYEG